MDSTNETRQLPSAKKRGDPLGTHRQKKEKNINNFNAALLLPTTNNAGKDSASSLIDKQGATLASSLAHIQHASMKSDELLQSILVNNSVE